MNVQQELLNYITEQFLKGKGGNLKSDTALLSTGILDSISALQMVDFIEDKFGIEFEAHEVDQDNLHSVETITNFILNKQKAK